MPYHDLESMNSIVQGGFKKGLMEVQREHSCMGQSPGEGTITVQKRRDNTDLLPSLVSMLFVAVIPVILLLLVSMGGTESIIRDDRHIWYGLTSYIRNDPGCLCRKHFVAHHVTKPIVGSLQLRLQDQQGVCAEGKD